MPSATPSISKQQFQAQSAGSVCVGNASRRNLGSSRSQSVCVRSTGPKQKEVSAGSARKNTPKVLFVPKACSEDPVLTKGSWERPTFWKGRPPSKVTQRLCGTQFDPRKGRWSPKMPWEWVCLIHTCGLVIKGLTWASIRQGISMPVVNTRKLTLPFSTLSNPMSLLPPHLTSLLPNGLGAVPCVLTASELNYQVKNGPFVPIVPLVTPKRPCVHCVTWIERVLKTLGVLRNKRSVAKKKGWPSSLLTRSLRLTRLNVKLLILFSGVGYTTVLNVSLSFGATLLTSLMSLVRTARLN